MPSTKNMKWPVRVTGYTHDWDGKRVRFCRYEEGTGDCVGALLRAVLAQPNPGKYLGTEIKGLTPLGQVCLRIFEVDNDQNYYMQDEHPRNSKT